MHSRPARVADAAAIARIYNEGIEERVATFETCPRTTADVERWFDEGFPLVVVTSEAGDVLGWASAHAYRPGRDAYAGVAESRCTSAARRVVAAPDDWPWRGWSSNAWRSGMWKLVSRIFPDNAASLALCRATGFREVGVYRRHGKLDGQWRDCVIVERLIGEAADN